jgi:hypothetical protein
VSRKNVGREGRKRSQKWYEKKKNKNTEDNENEHELGSASSSSKTEWLVVKLPSHKTPAKEDLYAKNLDDPSEKLTDKMTNFPLKTNNYKEVTKGYKNV